MNPAATVRDNRCGIGLGSNLGDRLAHLREAGAALQKLNAGPGPAFVSPVYETEPVDCEPGAAAFLNAVIEIGVGCAPDELLAALQRIEAFMGRPADHPRNAPRTIDLDILYIGALTVHTDDLQIPHPRLHLRRFVLQPLAEIRPGLVLPGFRETVSDLLQKLPPTPAVTRVSSDWLVRNRDE